MQVIYHRANAMKGTLGGGRAWMVVRASAEAATMLGRRLEISVVNKPRLLRGIR
ncbi:hypothetical protein ACPA9J_27405 [Pseudomonas aeruginosa]